MLIEIWFYIIIYYNIFAGYLFLALTDHVSREIWNCLKMGLACRVGCLMPDGCTTNETGNAFLIAIVSFYTFFSIKSFFHKWWTWSQSLISSIKTTINFLIKILDILVFIFMFCQEGKIFKRSFRLIINLLGSQSYNG